MERESKPQKPKSVPIMTKDGVQIQIETDGALSVSVAGQRVRSHALVDLSDRPHLKLFAVAAGYFAATAELNSAQIAVEGNTSFELRPRTSEQCGRTSPAKTQLILTIIDDMTGDLVLEEIFPVGGNM